MQSAVPTSFRPGLPDSDSRDGHSGLFDVGPCDACDVAAHFPSPVVPAQGVCLRGGGEMSDRKVNERER